MTYLSKKYSHLFIIAAGLVVIIGALHGLHNNTTYELILYVLLCAAFCLLGMTLGARFVESRSKITQKLSDKINQNTSGASFSKPKESHHRLYTIVDELTLLHTSGDLYERYQCFIQLVEGSLQPSLGSCDITLWCLDHDPEYLIECRIPSTTRLTITKEQYAPHSRSPFRIKLDCPVIRHALETQQPCMINSLQKVAELHRCPKDQLLSDACIPLYRDYGHPVIVAIKRMRPYVITDNNEYFYQACKLIKLFWDQLQIANQRHWQSEHDLNDKVLHEQAFIEHAQKYAREATKHDDLFCLVVITLQGFRSMFAGHSQQWRRLSSLTAQTLRRCLDQSQQEFLLGKMADDVFAILLHRSDKFLAKAVMDKVLSDFDHTLNTTSNIDNHDLTELTIQWTLADHHKYQYSITDMLDNIYGGLFPPGIDQPLYEYRMNIPSAQQEVQV